ncbi:MAG: hypothetical protein U1E14_18105 [Geminicoccaceae bacterium]
MMSRSPSRVADGGGVGAGRGAAQRRDRRGDEVAPVAALRSAPIPEQRIVGRELAAEGIEVAVAVEVARAKACADTESGSASATKVPASPFCSPPWFTSSWLGRDPPNAGSAMATSASRSPSPSTSPSTTSCAQELLTNARRRQLEGAGGSVLVTTLVEQDEAGLVEDRGNGVEVAVAVEGRPAPPTSPCRRAAAG